MYIPCGGAQWVFFPAIIAVTESGGDYSHPCMMRNAFFVFRNFLRGIIGRVVCMI